jgi:hypothetical protein
VALLKFPVKVELTVEVGDQFVVTDRLDVAPVQLPDVCACASGTRTALATRPRKSAQKICREEKDREFFIVGELEFYGVGRGREKGRHRAEPHGTRLGGLETMVYVRGPRCEGVKVRRVFV